MEITMFTSSFKKLLTVTVLATTFAPALSAANLQSEYCYLSMLIHNANATAFKKELDQLVATPKAKTTEFRTMLTTLARDVEHTLLNTQAMRGADVSGNIADNGYSQLKWGIGESVVAAGMFAIHSKYQLQTPQVYYVVAAGLGSGILGILSLKNSVSTYLLARRYGKHIQTSLEALEEIKKEIALQLKCVTS